MNRITWKDLQAIWFLYQHWKEIDEDVRLLIKHEMCRILNTKRGKQ